MTHVKNNTNEVDWYSPTHLVDAARRVMGGIDLDPASCEVANTVVRAATFYTSKTNGLAVAWHGRVWLNPPYSARGVDKFTRKLRAEYEADRVEQAVVLVNNATETVWFQAIACPASALCLPRGRLKFWHPERTSAPLQGQALLYLGPDPVSFCHEFSAFGITTSNLNAPTVPGEQDALFAYRADRAA